MHTVQQSIRLRALVGLTASAGTPLAICSGLERVIDDMSERTRARDACSQRSQLASEAIDGVYRYYTLISARRRPGFPSALELELQVKKGQERKRQRCLPAVAAASRQ